MFFSIKKIAKIVGCFRKRRYFCTRFERKANRQVADQKKIPNAEKITFEGLEIGKLDVSL